MDDMVKKEEERTKISTTSFDLIFGGVSGIGLFGTLLGLNVRREYQQRRHWQQMQEKWWQDFQEAPKK